MLIATTTSFAASEGSCINPNQFSIYHQSCSIEDSQSPCILSSEQAKHPAGNDEYLNFYREMVSDEPNDHSEADNVAQADSVEGEGLREIASEESIGTTTGREELVRDCRPMPQPERTRERDSSISIQQEMVYSHNSNPNSPFGHHMNDKVAQQEHSAGPCRSNQDGSIATEPEDTVMHGGPDSEDNGDSHSDYGHHQAVMIESPLETRSRRKRSNVPSVPQSSRSRKNKSITTQSSSSRSIVTCKASFLEKGNALLEEYISQHRKKYENLGIPCPGDYIDSVETKNHLISFGLESHTYILQVFSFTIGGHESIIGLKNILRVYRNPEIRSLQIEQEVSNAKRVQAIKRLETKEAHINLLKRCHVHQLYVDNADPLDNPCDNFIVSTITSTAQRKQTGNPRNAAESKVKKSMVADVYPNIQPGSREYGHKYREISLLRKNGRRLALLVSKFGRGILGLLPLAQDESRHGMTYKIFDTL